MKCISLYLTVNTVYPREPDPDGRDRDEIECSSSEEDEEISDDEATVTASVGRAVVSSDMRGAGASTSNRQGTWLFLKIILVYCGTLIHLSQK